MLYKLDFEDSALLLRKLIFIDPAFLIFRITLLQNYIHLFENTT